MRITSSMMTNSYLYNLNGNLSRLSKYLEQEATGKAINRISDDPVKTTQSLSARNKLSVISRYQENANTADSWLTEVEEAVNELNDIIGSAYEKSVAASTGTLNDSDLSAIAQEIGALRDEVLSTANATFGDSYLFAGYNTTGSSGGDLPYAVDASGDLYYNGINVSNEASADDITGASVAAAKALADIGAADASVQGTAVSDYNEIIQGMETMMAAADKVLGSAEKAGKAAADIAASADIDAATAAALTTASGALETAAATLSSAIQDANNTAAVAQDASKTAAKAHAVWEEALKSGDGAAISEAENAYNDAVAAAQAAAADAQTFSSAVLTAAGDVRNAIDDGDPATGTDVQSIIDNSTALGEASAAIDAQREDVFSIQVGAGQLMAVTVVGTELLGRGDENLYVVLDDFYNALKSGADESEINESIARLQEAQTRTLSLGAEIGARHIRINMLSARYEANILNYSEMKSDAEDADLADVITNYTTAQTVYNAALSAGSEIIRTSLLDFLN